MAGRWAPHTPWVALHALLVTHIPLPSTCPTQPSHKLTQKKPVAPYQVKYDQEGNIVVREVRDYLGALTDVERVDKNGRPLPGVTDAELAVMQVGGGVFFVDVLRVCVCREGGHARLGEGHWSLSPCY